MIKSPVSPSSASTKTADFEKAIEVLLKHEGGYSNNKNDAGGETAFGISKKSYPNINISSLTQSDAIAIYYKDWWLKHHYDKINSQSLSTKLLDTAVNIGAKKAHELLQTALHDYEIKLEIDGVMGNQTLDAIQTLADQNKLDALLDRFRILLCHYYLQLVDHRPANKVFLYGWLRRALS